ncbi:MAG: formyltransferase family protein [Anaerolineae bacterium]|nr:formyltransferase family protein [Anaerolineae bacterium]
MVVDGRRIVYFGMAGEFSRIPFEKLLAAGANVAAVVFPRPGRAEGGPRWLPAAAKPIGSGNLLLSPAQPNILALAARHQIPVLEVGALKSAAALDAFKALKADLGVVACFPRLLPEAWLEATPLGCLNLHPSLLPAYRGPYPMFWQLRAGDTRTGVTLHRMDAGTDTGDIVAQREASWPEGARDLELDRLAASLGADMLIEALALEQLPRKPQPNHGASYQGAPTEADRVISLGWAVRRAFNFVRGARAWAPFWVDVGDGRHVQVDEALAFELGSEQPHGYIEGDGEKRFQFSDGVLAGK